MDEKYQEKAIEALRDWCKWLISLNVFAGTGCIIVLERGVSSQLKPVLVGAILLFALAALVAVLIIGGLTSVIQALPLRDETGASINVHDYLVWRHVSLGWLARLQLMLFVLGIVLLLSWIVLKPS